MTYFALKTFDWSILNKKTNVEIENRSKRLRNEIIAQTTSFVVAINIEIFLRNESIFETKNVKMKWSSKKITKKRIIRHLLNSTIKSTFDQINSSIHKKFAKIKQNSTCKIASFLIRISKNFKICNKISRMIIFLSRFSRFLYIRLISLISRYNKNSLKTLKSKYFRSMQTKRKIVM